MIKTFFIVVIAAIILISGFVFGWLPGLSVLEYKTESRNIAGAVGNPSRELLDSKGYTLAYKNDELSEKIVVTGQIKRNINSLCFVDKYEYWVYLKKDQFSDWQKMSTPGNTSKYFSNPNPGVIELNDNWFSGEGGGETYSLEPYQFRLEGHDYANGAIRVELRGYLKENQLLPLANWHWVRISSDEADLHSGYGSLTLPRGVEDGVERPYTTFEVGQEVKIKVETAKGGSGANPWKVTLNEPYTNDKDVIEDLYTDSGYTGGGVVKSQSYPNDALSYFTFKVTEEMAEKSMSSQYPYIIRIWNSLLPKGSIQIDFVDFIAGAPSNVKFYIGNNEIKPGEVNAIQSKVGEEFSVRISANSDFGIDYYRVAVIYGSDNVLLPSDPTSNLWIIHTTNYGDKDGQTVGDQVVTFKPMHEDYVSIHAKAFDVDGRGSPSTLVMQIWCYSTSPVPDEVIDDETGVDYYGGGHTEGWHQWDPGEGSGNWENPDTGEPIVVDLWGVMVAVIIVLGFIGVGFVMFKEPRMMAAMGIIGTIVAIFVYIIFFTSTFAGIIVFG